jgi:hypothetical protein
MLVLDMLKWAWQMGFLPFVGGGGSQVYEIRKSLRLRSAASAYLSRTMSGASTSAVARTVSMWVKRGTLASAGRQGLYYEGTSGVTGNIIFCEFVNDTLRMAADSGGTQLATTASVFRDVAAFYHLVFVYDSANATAGDRMRIYVNGVRQSTTGTNPSLNQAFGTGATNIQAIGRLSTNQFDGYVSEIHVVDGQALDPSNFGKTDASTGAWIPKKYTGGHGNNGSYLSFLDGTSLTTLGHDDAGSNDWTLNSVSLTAGTTYDWMEDTPSNNFPVINPLANAVAPVAANQQVNSSSASYSGACSIVMPSGKWYFEAVQISGTAHLMIGVVRAGGALGTPFWQLAGGYAYWASTGQKYNNNAAAAYGSSYAVGDVIGVAFDASAGTLEFFKNNVSQGVAFTGLTQGDYVPAIGNGSGVAHNSAINFGQRPFSYTPPSGYKALSTNNLPTPAVKRGSRYFNSLLYTGNSDNPQSITGAGFQPDLIWLKNRAAASHGIVVDAVRGRSAHISTSVTSAQATDSSTQGVTSIDADGFSVDDDPASYGSSNDLTNAYVAWLWKEAAGLMDIVTYTGSLTTTGTQTVPHNLGVAPSLILSRSLNVAGVDSGNMGVWHHSLAANKALFLNTTAAQFDTVSSGGGTKTPPTSTDFYQTYNSGFGITGNNYIAYLFAEVEGFSKMGSYTGNGSADGPAIWTGFRSRWVMIKRTDTTGNWVLIDTARNTSNLSNFVLYGNLSQAEDAPSVGRVIDILSNGFKLRGTDSDVNTSGGTYIFVAIAETPVKYANAR